LWWSRGKFSQACREAEAKIVTRVNGATVGDVEVRNTILPREQVMVFRVYVRNETNRRQQVMNACKQLGLGEGLLGTWCNI
jgi:hypothetical protein